MTTTTETRTLSYVSNGELRTIDVTYEVQTVRIRLNGEDRDVKIESPDGKRWNATEAVLLKFRTGTKLHRDERPQVFRRQDGSWFVGPQVIHNRRANPVRWADGHNGSGWNR